MKSPQSVIQNIFGQPTLPNTLPSIINQGVLSPISGLTNLLRCDRLTSNNNGHISFGYLHFNNNPNSKLMLLWQGHTSTYDEIGLGDLARELMKRGYDVLICGMPGHQANGGFTDHNQYTNTSNINLLRYFLLPAVEFLNHAAPGHSFVGAAGISGGGWGVTFLAGLDSRILLSCEIAGTLPPDLETGGSPGDKEQLEQEVVCPTVLLYYWGASRSGGGRLQILNELDPSNHSKSGVNGAYGNNYIIEVARWLNPLAVADGGFAKFWPDTTHNQHKVSSAAITRILQELGEDSTPVIQILNNGDSGFTTVGPWSYWTDQGYGSDVHQGIPNNGTTATWTFTSSPGQYKVSITWTAYSNRATNAPFTVLDGTTPLATVFINQRVAPVGFTDQGVMWQDLGTFIITSSYLVVRLDTGPGCDGYLNADAVRVERVG